MKAFILGFPLLLVLSSCGKATNTNSGLGDGVYRTNFTNDYLLLESESSNCPLTASHYGETLFDLPLFIQGQSVRKEMKFSPILQGIFLQNKNVIKDSTFGEKTEIIVSNNGAESVTHLAPKKIKICPDIISFRAETVESAALSTAYFINKTNLKFTSLVPDLIVNPITLNITPTIIHSLLMRNSSGELVKTSEYMTDNAYYIPYEESVTFLPHAPGSKQFLNANFWEVPMVASHEYGHHLFQMISMSKENRHGVQHSCFTPTIKRKLSGLKSNYRSVKIQDVINAYNEGFADLVSYYTLDHDERSVGRVGCLEITRDVGSPMLYDGKPKIFSQNTLRSFFSFYEDNSNGSCQNPSYQEIHVIGAIFAHNANSFLSELTTSEDEKLKAVVDWAKYLKVAKNEHSKVTSEDFLRITFSKFLKMSLLKFNRSFDDNICQSIEQFFPGLQTKECSR